VIGRTSLFRRRRRADDRPDFNRQLVVRGGIIIFAGASIREMPKQEFQFHTARLCDFFSTNDERQWLPVLVLEQAGRVLV
jgi:hypothetical protein